MQVWARKGDPCLGSPSPQLFQPSLHVRLPEVSELPKEQPAEALLSWPWWAGKPSTHPQGGPARSLANSQPHVLCVWTAARVLGGLSLPSGAMGGAERREELGPQACAGRGSCTQGPSSAADAAVGTLRLRLRTFLKIDKVQGLRSASRVIGLTAGQWGAGSAGRVCWE